MSQDTYHDEMSEIVLQNGSDALVAVGSNHSDDLLDVRETLLRAVKRAAEKGVMIRAHSRFFATPCFPKGAGPDFVNAAFSVSNVKNPRGLLSLLHDIEAEFGRERKVRWAQRSLDLDLLCVGATVAPNRKTVRHWIDLPLSQQIETAPDEMLLPHPRIQDRAFVLVPLMDVAPDWVHPVLNQSIRQMHDALPDADKKAVKPLDNP